MPFEQGTVIDTAQQSQPHGLVKARCASTYITCMATTAMIAFWRGICIQLPLAFHDCMQTCCDFRWRARLAAPVQQSRLCPHLPGIRMIYLSWHQRCSAQQIVQTIRLTDMHRMLLLPDLRRLALQGACQLQKPPAQDSEGHINAQTAEYQNSLMH